MTTHAAGPTTLPRRHLRPVPAQTRYLGVSDWWGRHVWVERAGVRTALRYRGEHRMPGFAWGRRGLAARELSRSLIEDATGSPMLAERFCRELTLDVIADLPEESFELDREQILAWLDDHAGPGSPPELAA